VTTSTDPYGFNVSNFIGDYVEFWPGLFSNLPLRVTTARESVLDLYVEGVPIQFPQMHNMDRTRWDKRLVAQLREGRLYRIDLTMPMGGNPMEANFSLHEQGMNYNAASGLFDLLDFQPIGEGVDFPGGMGATLNVWYGPDPYHALEIIQGTFTDTIPHNSIANVYEGRFYVALPNRWRLGNAYWTGYAPVSGQSISVSLNGQALGNDGSASDVDRPWQYAPGNADYRVTLSSVPGTTPFFEAISLLVITDPQMISYQFQN
jgi:hypothetical protein